MHFVIILWLILRSISRALRRAVACVRNNETSRPVKNYLTNKGKIINDPVYGFININSDLVFDLMQHPFIQRLRRIKQLGLTYFVYPGATHTRFQHALGAYYLMDSAITSLRSKGIDITADEEEAVLAAILLHDIGHGPFSHALESSIIEEIDHEDLSSLLMDQLNREFGGKLDLAIRIFRNRHTKGFLHQLVSSQLDMDRLDYLRRDSFFTGVAEGTIGSDRIIKMLHVNGDKLVVEIKGIYSLEKFLIARRLMFWQVYLHKTVIASEQLLVKILRRAKQLIRDGADLFATPALRFFLRQSLSPADLSPSTPSARRDEILHHFNLLDDNDIISAAKVWTEYPDYILSNLCTRLINRELFGVEIRNQPFSEELLTDLIRTITSEYRLTPGEGGFFAFTNSVSNHIYDLNDDRIQILHKNGKLSDISEVSDMINISALSKPVKKFYLCYPKEFVKLVSKYQ